MANICAICDKKPQVGNNVSHAKNRTKRWIYPNVQKVRFNLTGDNSGKVHRGAVCAKCLKAGKIKKVI